VPSGKELEQLPMSNIAPGMGQDQSQFDRKILNGYVDDEIRPMPSKAAKEDKKKK
jgi:hypothetical protein